MDAAQPITVEARDGFSIWLKYADGAAGVVDLSDLAARRPFRAWRNREFFEAVHVSDHRTIAWSDEIELCADALYSDLTGQSWDKMYPSAPGHRAHA